MELEIKKQAYIDLQNIWDYTFKNFGQAQADKYIDHIEVTFTQICKFSGIGKAYMLNDKEFRSTIVKSHIIFYKIINNEIVQIIRILHQKMDIESNLL